MQRDLDATYTALDEIAAVYQEKIVGERDLLRGEAHRSRHHDRDFETRKCSVSERSPTA